MARPILADQDFGSVARILNLLNAVDPQEPVTLAQLLAAIEGIAWKDNVVVSTQGNINLSAPGAAIDGITMSVGQRFLARLQTAQEERGIYIWNGAAVPATRAPDADTAAGLESATVTVDEGTDAGTTWRQTEVNFTLDTDPVLWVSFGTGVAAASEVVAGKAELATQGETDAGTDDERIVTPLKFKTSSLRAKQYAADLGDGAATSYTITHNFNTRDIVVMVRQNAGNYEAVECEVRINNVNSIDLLFAAAPTTNALRVIIYAHG